MTRVKLTWHGTGIKGDSQRLYGFDATDLGHVFKTADGEWGASWMGGFDTYKTRKEAMARVEREVAKQRRRKGR